MKTQIARLPAVPLKPEILWANLREEVAASAGVVVSILGKDGQVSVFGSDLGPAEFSLLGSMADECGRAYAMGETMFGPEDDAEDVGG